MTIGVGEVLVAQENGSLPLALETERLPARLTVDATVVWVDSKILWIRLPEARVVLQGQRILLPATKVKLAVMTRQYSWRSQEFEACEARIWEGAAFYGRVNGQIPTAKKATYYTRKAWDEHLRALGDLAPAGAAGSLAAHAVRLGVALEASRDEVIEAFRVKAKAAHPDAGGDPEEFRRLLEAREALLFGK
jgi:hypothetical protein